MANIRKPDPASFRTLLVGEEMGKTSLKNHLALPTAVERFPACVYTWQVCAYLTDECTRAPGHVSVAAVLVTWQGRGGGFQ